MTEEPREASFQCPDEQPSPCYTIAMDYLLGRKLVQLGATLRSRVARLRSDGAVASADPLERLLNQFPRLGEDGSVSVDLGSGMFRMTRYAARIIDWLDGEIVRYRSGGKDAADTLDVERNRLLRAIRAILGPHAQVLFEYASELHIDSSAPTQWAARLPEDAIATQTAAKAETASDAGSTSMPLPVVAESAESDTRGTGALATEPISQVLDEDDRQLRGPIAPLVEKAIEQADSDKFPAVYGKLRQMALNSEQPFTGEITDQGDLCYTDDNNKVRRFTKDALSVRLRRRRQRT